MQKTQVVQDCYEYRLSDSTAEFRMEFSVTAAGELPHTQIFVYSIGDKTDPGTDSFSRVASTSDLKNYQNKTRDQAILAGLTEYLASSMSISYPRLDVAVQAKSVLTTRINDCINAWVSYRDSFYDDGSTPVPFPTVDPAYEQNLKDTYADAKAARIAAEEAVTAAETAIVLAEKDADNAEAILAIYENEVAFCTRAGLTDWAGLSPAINLFKSGSLSRLTEMKSTFVTLANAVVPSSVHHWPPTPAELSALGANWTAWYNEMASLTDGWETLINDYNTTGAPLATDLSSTLTTFCQSAAANVVAQTNIKVVKDAAVTAAVQAKQEAEAVLASASEAEAAALAAVKSVCPDFDPTSV